MKVTKVEYRKDKWTVIDGNTLTIVRIHSHETDPRKLEQILDLSVEHFLGRKIYRRSQRYIEDEEHSFRLMGSEVGDHVFFIGPISLDEDLNPELYGELIYLLNNGVRKPKGRKVA